MHVMCILKKKQKQINKKKPHTPCLETFSNAVFFNIFDCNVIYIMVASSTVLFSI